MKIFSNVLLNVKCVLFPLPTDVIHQKIKRYVVAQTALLDISVSNLDTTLTKLYQFSQFINSTQHSNVSLKCIKQPTLTYYNIVHSVVLLNFGKV
jgi:hypothetical protein